METHVSTEAKTPFIDLFLRSIAVLGLIAVLLLGAWGIIQLAVAIPTLFSNIGSGKSILSNTNAQKEAVAVTLPASTTSGQTVQLAWSHTNKDAAGQYSYAISYACQSGLTLGVPVPTGAYQGAPCNTPFNYVNATEHMIVIPVLTATSSATSVTFTVTATKLSTGAITAVGSSTIVVNPSSTPVKPVVTTPKPVTTKKPVASTPKPSTTYYPAATRAALYGYPDLAVNIISVIPNGSRTTVQFVIANTGTNTVASGWSFNAMLPINGSFTFASQPQQALYPGDKIVYNLSFDNTFGQAQNGFSYSGSSYYNTNGYTCDGYNCNTVPTNYNTGYNYNGTPYTMGTVSITADPFNYVAETSKANNTASITTQVY